MLDFVKTQKEALETIAAELDEEAVTQFIRSKLMELFDSMENDLFATQEQSMALLKTIELYSTGTQKKAMEALWTVFDEDS